MEKNRSKEECKVAVVKDKDRTFTTTERCAWNLVQASWWTSHASSLAVPGEKPLNSVSVITWTRKTFTEYLPRECVTRTCKLAIQNLFPKELLSPKESNKPNFAFLHHHLMNKHVSGPLLRK